MGALVLRKLTDHKDNIDITTTVVSEQPDGSVAKRSSVTTTATHNQPGKDLWFGLKISTRQAVHHLTVERKVWISRRSTQDKEAVKAFRRIFPPKSGETWVAYRINRGDVPIGFTFETELTLNRHVAEYPDAQSIAILACYMPDPGSALKPDDVLIGHSLVQAPAPKRTGARKR